MMKQSQVSSVPAVSVSKTFLLILLSTVHKTFALQWNDAGDIRWALSCDFNDNDIGSQGSPGEQCGNVCSGRSDCTHFSWTNYNGGTCWMKGNCAGSESSAISKDNDGAVCGFLKSRCSGGSGGLVSLNEFQTAVSSLGYPSPTADQYNAFVNGFPHGSITTKQEAAMALTHFTWESDGLRAKREYACVNTGCPGSYETPGCDAPGQDYFGRGYIQLSWCYNYAPCSQALFGDKRLVSDPDFVARDEATAWNSAFWFWQVNVHSKPGVSEGRFGVTTRAINGGLECDGAHQDKARHRYEMYKTVRRAFGLAGDGNETGCYN